MPAAQPVRVVFTMTDGITGQPLGGVAVATGLGGWDFSAFEQIQMRMMLLRPAGTTWPDTDRSLVGFHSAGFTRTLVFRE